MERSRDNLLCCVMALAAVGLVMAFSVSAARVPTPQDGLRTLARHGTYVALGAGALFLMARTDYRRLYAWRWPIYALAIALLALVLVPGVGALRNNARRWFSVGGVSLQPSEFAKLAIVVALAGWAAASPERMGRFFAGFLPGLVLTGAVAGLVLLGPDFGTALLLACVGALVLLVGGAKVWHAALAAAPGAAAALVLVVQAPYRLRRITAFLDPWEHYSGAGYQLIHSLVALGSGGTLGSGPGASVQKLYFLPEPGTDFVFAILGEEFGMVGSLGVLALFAIFLVEGMRISGRAPDLFGSLLAFGLTACIALQAVVNIAVVTASAPTKGIPLPFVSMGGSSLLFSMAATGILCSIAAQAQAAAGPSAAGLQEASAADGKGAGTSGKVSAKGGAQP